MLSLDLPAEPCWLTLPRGVRVEILSVTIVVMTANMVASAHRRSNGARLVRPMN
jgi:hypothetical protein